MGQAERLALHLSRAAFEPDVILTSPKLRALQTAEIVAAALGRELVVEERLGAPLDLAVLERVLADAGHPQRPVLVGHDPDFSELLTLLTGAPGLEMKKGALARIDINEGLRESGGVLRWLLPPDLLSGG